MIRGDKNVPKPRRAGGIGTSPQAQLTKFGDWNRCRIRAFGWTGPTVRIWSSHLQRMISPWVLIKKKHRAPSIHPTPTPFESRGGMITSSEELRMSKPTRRKFIQSGATIGLSAVAYSRVARAATDGGRPMIGFVGCGGRSKSLLRGFRDDAIVAWAYDPDEQRAIAFQASSGAKQVTSDLRHVLEINRWMQSWWQRPITGMRPPQSWRAMRASMCTLKSPAVTIFVKANCWSRLLAGTMSLFSTEHRVETTL